MWGEEEETWGSAKKGLLPELQREREGGRQKWYDMICKEGGREKAMAEKA